MLIIPNVVSMAGRFGPISMLNIVIAMMAADVNVDARKYLSPLESAKNVACLLSFSSFDSHTSSGFLFAFFAIL